jgi:nitric oxide reductase NorD protein
MASHSESNDLIERLHHLFREEFSEKERQRLADTLNRLSGSVQSRFIQLLEELLETSSKAAIVCLRQIPAMLDQIGEGPLPIWLDLGIELAGQSSVTAVKYFQESPDLLAKIPTVPARQQTLMQGIEIAEMHYSILLDYLRACPAVLQHLPLEALPDWAELGISLSDEDTVLAVEYFRASPEIVSALRVTDLQAWAMISRQLVRPNQLEKPDYLPAIEYFRLSASIIGQIKPKELVPMALSLIQAVISSSPRAAMELMNALPEILLPIASPEFRKLTLQLGLDIAAAWPQAAGIYFKFLPRIIRQIHEAPDTLEQWVRIGLASGAKSAEEAVAYFGLQSKSAQAALDDVTGGLSLDRVNSVLKLFAEALCGRIVKIASIEALPEELRGPGRIRTDRKPTRLPDGQVAEETTIYLPARLKESPERETNFAWYKVMTAHEAGHLEFGTYAVTTNVLESLLPIVEAAYGKRHPITRPDEFFTLFPNPALAKFLWMIVEDTRVDYLLRHEYEGLVKLMDTVATADLSRRPGLDSFKEMPPYQVLLEALVQLSFADTTEVPLDYAQAVGEAYELLKSVKQQSATALTSFEILIKLYRFVEQFLKQRPPVAGDDPFGSDSSRAALPPVTSETTEALLLSKTENLSYRGEMRDLSDRSDQTKSSAGQSAAQIKTHRSEETAHTIGSVLKSSDTPQQTSVNEAPTPAATGQRIFFYDEWDAGTGDYKPAWCRLIETTLEEENQTFVDRTLAEHSGLIFLLRRYFQGLRPGGLRTARRQQDGEDLDLDAVTMAMVESAAGQAGSDQIYLKRIRQEREVAVALLIDMSGSTNRQLDGGTRRVMDVEKEGLLLLAEAIHAIGDSFAIYGFSGNSRQDVEFFIIKEFEEPFRASVSARIGAMAPRVQNRDGTAIRHATLKLAGQTAQTRLLILLSDGRPLDDGYSGDYAVSDTKMALREAKRLDIHPHCITIDTEAQSYLNEMYGDVSYTIIDHVRTLPEKLPRIYRRLTR